MTSVAGKGRGVDLPLEPPERDTAQPTQCLQPIIETHFGMLTSKNDKIIHLYCFYFFKYLSIWLHQSYLQYVGSLLRHGGPSSCGVRA